MTPSSQTRRRARVHATTSAQRAAATAPDDRIAQRRSGVKAAARRSRLAIFGVIALVVAVGSSGFAALHSPLFSMRRLTITGAIHENRSEILRAAGIVGTPPLIDIDPGRAAVGIEALAWVGRASVSRHWPETLSVSIVERSAVGYTRRALGGFALLDSSGRVLATAGGIPGGLLRLDDLGHLPAVGGTVSGRGGAIASLAAAIPKTITPIVASVGDDSADGLEITLSIGPRVEIGTSAALGAKFVALATLIASERPTLLGSSVVDLRVPTSPVLTPSPSSPIVR